MRRAAAVFGLWLGAAIWCGAQTVQTLSPTAVMPNPGAPKPAVLGAGAEATLKTLSELNTLPMKEWQYHEGDVDHGERPELDDSQWKTVTAPFDAPNGAVWFRRTVVVPEHLQGYDVTGAKVWFEFDVDANGPMPMIIYFNGRRVAEGEDLEPIVLVDAAKPGEKVVIAVKVLHTVDTKRFRGVVARMEYLSARPNPVDFATEAKCAQVLIPAVTADSADATAKLEQAIDAVDTKALAAGEQAAFDASLTRAQAQLTALRPQLATAFVRITGNSHIDAAWLWPWTETVDVVRRTFGTALQLMDEYPRYTYTQSASAYDEWVAEKYPDEFKQIQARVKDGRWEMVGGMWVEPDLNMPDGESLVRQLLIGKRYIKQKFGVDVRIGWNPDSFGYNWQLPQIYKKSGIDYFVTQKLFWNDTNKLPLKLFWWQAPDGSRVLTYFPHDYANDIEPLQIAKDFATARGLNPGTNEMMHLYGVGDHGGGPTRDMLDAADHWMATAAGEPKRAPVYDYSVAQKYFSDVETRLDTAHAPVWNYKTLAEKADVLPQPPAGDFALPVWNDELYLEYHRGVYTTQTAHKRNMRDSEEWMLDAEKWSAIAWLGGAKYPQEKLNEAWKKVLFNQFHDLAAGSGIGDIYEDAQRDYDVVHWTAEDATRNAMDAIAAQVNTRAPAALGKDAVPVMVWNSLGWMRTGVVRVRVQLTINDAEAEFVDASGAVMPSQRVVYPEEMQPSGEWDVVVRDVPAMGYKVIWARPTGHAEPSAGDVRLNGNVLENKYLRVTVDAKSGCITHLVDKRTGFDSIAAGGCGNELQTFVDKPKDYDAWNIDANALDQETGIDAADEVKFEGARGTSVEAQIKRHFGNSTFVQRIVLSADMPYVEVQNDVQWHEKHVLLKAAFPLAAGSDAATYEIPYGSIERPTTRNNSWEKAKFEVPALRWADEGDGADGFSVLNNSKYGYDAKGNVLRLTLLRSPTWPDAEADQGEQKFAYALYPHAGDWRAANTVAQGYEFNYRLSAKQVAAHAGAMASARSFARVATGTSPNHVVLTAMKKTEDGDGLLLRFYEWAGKADTVTLKLPAGAGSAWETNLMEVPDGDALAVKQGELIVGIKPYEIKTVRVEMGPTVNWWAAEARER
jgi:alpha-mannosidase